MTEVYRRTVGQSDRRTVVRSSQPVGKTGVWSKLAWTQDPWRSTPLQAAGVQGRRSLGQTAPQAKDGPLIFYLRKSA